MLKVESVTKSYGKQVVLDKLSLEFERGVYALLGPNGAGKSTLMNILVRALPYNEGEIFYFGENIKSNKDYLSKLGYSPQVPSFYNNYNAKELLTYIGYLKGMSKNEISTQMPRLLKSVNLSDVGKKFISKYSGGMKQRLGIAQALLGSPEILVFDEPTAGLDPKERARFRNLVSSIKKDKTIIIATHIVSDIDTIADKVLIFSEGKVIKQGSISELCQDLDGLVFELSTENLEILPELNISKIIENRGMYTVRYIGEKASEFNSMKVQPTLEDVYLYYFGA